MRILIFATAAINTEKGVFVCRSQLQAFDQSILIKTRIVVEPPFDNGKLDAHRAKLSSIVHALHTLDKNKLAQQHYELLIVTNYEHAAKIGRGAWRRTANLDLWTQIDEVLHHQPATWIWVSSGSKQDDRDLLTEIDKAAFEQFCRETQTLAHL